MPVIIDPEYHYNSVNVENQERNPFSLLWWTKRAIAWRKRFKAPGRGTLEFLFPENPKVLAFIRTYQEESILVVANLSKYFQVAELDLSKHAGSVPEEVASQNRFPAIKESPYVLTLGPHNYLLLSIKKPEERISAGAERIIPELHTTASWEAALDGETAERLESEILPKYLMTCRWFGGKARTIREVKIVERVPVVENSNVSYLLFLEVRYMDGPQDSYLLPVSFALTKKAEESREELIVEGLRVKLDSEWSTVKSKLVMEEFPQSVLARLYARDGEGLLYDGAYDSKFRDTLFTAIARRKKVKGKRGELLGHQGEDVSKTTPSGRFPFELPDPEGGTDEYLDSLCGHLLLQALSESA